MRILSRRYGCFAAGGFFFGEERVWGRTSLQGYDISYLWLVNILILLDFVRDVGRKSDETTIGSQFVFPCRGCLWKNQ